MEKGKTTKTLLSEVIPFIVMVIMELGCTIGLTIFAKTSITNGMSPFVFIVYTNALATTILFPSSFLSQHQDRKDRPPFTFSLFMRFLLLGFTGISMAQNLLFLGLSYSSPILVCAMGHFIPTFNFLLNAICRKIELNFRSSSIQVQVIGMLVSIMGGVLAEFFKGPLIIRPSSHHHLKLSKQLFVFSSTPEFWVLGGILLAAAFFSLSLANFILKETVKQYYPEEPMKVISYYSSLGTILSAIISCTFEKDVNAWKLKRNMDLVLILQTALKALVLERMGKPEEAFSVSLNAKELLYGNDSLLMDDLTLSTLQIVFQRLDHLDLATECYEHACAKFSNNLELMMGLCQLLCSGVLICEATTGLSFFFTVFFIFYFLCYVSFKNSSFKNSSLCCVNCYVREYSFVKQQQTAIKMYKLAGEERFLLWAVCSIQLQVLCGNGGDKLLVLAEGLLKKHVASHSLHEPEALMIYISILEQQAKFGDALEILSGKLGSLLMIEVDKLRMQGRLLAQAGDYTAAADIFHKILESCPDDWECFLHYLACLLEDGTIWADMAVNDPVHPPKFANCKVSHLTDEQFDSQLSVASAFIQKLKDTPDNFIRGPYLAAMEIERRKHLRGKGSDENLVDGIVQYFCRFGHLPCFTSDVEMFVEVVPTDKKAELLEKLIKNNDTLSTPPIKTLGLSMSLFKIKQSLLDDMFKSSASDLVVSCVQMFDMYCKNLPLSKDLDPQESIHGEELLSMTCNILVQLFWRTKNVGYLVEAIMVLEFGLAIRRHVSQYKILLLHLYCHFGAFSVAHEWYKSLDVKNILMESILHHILPQMLVSPLWTELNSLLNDYLKFMDDHFRESADLTFLAYRHRNYSKVIEFVQFKDRLQHSSQYLVARVETPILQLKQNAHNIEEEEGILQSLKCGIHFLELSNEIGSKSLTFNEDLQTRPWWTPTMEKNYLLGPFEGISYCPREILTKERDTSLKRTIEKKSLLPRMIYLSMQCASSSIKEHVQINGSATPDTTLELKLLLERFAQFLGFSFSEAVEVVMGFYNGERSVVSDSNLIDWLNFTVFLNAWNLSSHELIHPDKNGRRPHIWNILDSLLEKNILEKVKSSEPQLCSPWNDIQLLTHLVTEPLAWHGLVIQSCLRSCLPLGKKKKKSGSAYQSSSNLVHAITDSVQQLSLMLEDVMKWISEWNRRHEDENLEHILSLLRIDGHNDGPGHVFHVLETFILSMNDSELGDRIYQSLKSWSPADAARKITTGKLKVLMEFSAICESKLKLLQSVKHQIAQL